MAEAMSLLPWTFSNVDLNQPAMNEARILRNENSENRSHCLEEFIDILLEDVSIQPFLDMSFLMRFLRGAKYNCSRAHKRLKRCFTIRSQHPEIFGTFLPSFTLNAQSLNHISLLPKRGKDNSVIVIHKIGNFDPHVASFEEFIRLDFLVIESLLQNPVTQLCGITAILDLRGLPMSELLPSRIQTLFEIYHSSCSARVTHVHVINAHGLINDIYGLGLPLMAPKMKMRFFSHSSGDLETLHTHIPAEILPEEYSGHLQPSELVDLYTLINHNEDYFVSQIGCGLVDET